MLSALSALLLAATPPTTAQAQAFVDKGAWDELYLAFAAVKPEAYGKPDRARLSAALTRGCHALEGSDAALASSLGDKAAQLEPTADALLCLARTSRASDQRAAAETALRDGLKAFPKNGAFGLELGKLLLDEKDAAGAAVALRTVPRSAKESAEAQQLLRKATAAQAEDRSATQQAVAIERRMSGQGASSGGGAGPGSNHEPGNPVRTARGGARAQGETQPASLTYESGSVGGMRTRANSRFVLKYFNNDRDFGQRAEYEGRVAAAMDEAYETSEKILGEARSAPVDVVLYTREEFIANFSANTARKVAGLYSMDSIRVNDAAELTQQSRATLVHEYIHAVVDDHAGGQAHRLPTWFNEGLAEYVEWRYLGGDGAPLGLKKALLNMDKAGRLPTLAAMDRGMLVNDPDPAASYAFSAMAVQQLLEQGGPGKLLDLVREVGHGEPFEAALAARYSLNLAQLQDATRQELSHR